MITSRKNPEIIEVSKLVKKKYRDQKGLLLIEGLKTIQEALTNNIKFKKIYIIPDLLTKINIPSDIDVIEVNKKVIEKISTSKNPEGISAVIEKPKIISNNSYRYLFLDKIRDPGNLGTIIRTADAAGFDTIYCSKDCVDIFNDKVIRSTMGSIFHIPIVENVDLIELAQDLKKQKFEIIGSSLEGELIYLNRLQIPDKFALVLGNESNGINDNLLSLCNKKIKLPIYGKAESLNVAVAAGILMYAYTDQYIS